MAPDKIRISSRVLPTHRFHCPLISPTLPSLHLPMTNSIILQFEGKNNPARAWELWFGAVNFASVSGLTFGNNYAILIINSSVPWLYGLPASAQRGIMPGFADISRSVPYPFGKTNGINSEPCSRGAAFCGRLIWDSGLLGGEESERHRGCLSPPHRALDHGLPGRADVTQDLSVCDWSRAACFAAATAQGWASIRTSSA